MAAFLFFLSVALVLTNREDIHYTLFVDHKMRCNLAADGMLNYALSTMRTTTNWEGKFADWKLNFQSGAVGTVHFRHWVEPQAIPGASRFSPPLTASESTGIELIATGTSGLFSSERHVLLEEFRFADSMLEGGKKPHLFNVSPDGKVAVLAPNLIWEEVGNTLFPPLVNTISAGGGALVHLSEGQGAPPPVIKDYARHQVTEDLMVNGEFAVTTDQIPQGHGAFMLSLENNKWEWKQLPDPGEQLVEKVLLQAGTSPDDGGVAAAGWDAATLDWDKIALTPSDLEVDYSYFNGPKVNWYALTGTRAERLGDEYICHGTHYFYVGLKLKNTPDGPQTRSQSRKGNLLHEPCILSFNLKTQKWSILFDRLRVSPDPMEEPTVLPGPRPVQASLLLLPGPLVHTHVEEQPDNSWYVVSKDQMSPTSLPKRAGLFALGSQLLYTEPRPDADVTPPLMALNRHDIAPYFPKFLPELNVGAVYDPKGKTPGGFEPQLNLRWSLEEKSFTGCNQDLFALARLVVSKQAPGQAPSNTQMTGLAHFDGKRWQILPAGLGRLLPETSSYRSELNRDYAGGDGPVGSTGKLLLGGYPSDKALLRRYVPVARWGGN